MLARRCGFRVFGNLSKNSVLAFRKCSASEISSGVSFVMSTGKDGGYGDYGS